MIKRSTLLLVITYLAAYAYWERQNHRYWACQSIDDSSCDILRPDGIMGIALFVITPFIILGLYIAWALFNQRRSKNRGKL